MPQTTINGFRCHYDYVEHRPGAPTVAFLNGIMSPLESWNPQLAVIERLGWNALRHEYRGQWRSEVPPGSYSLRQHADDLAALMDHLNIPAVHIVGTSYGGFVGMSFAPVYPQRCLSLMLIASTARIRPLSQAMVRNWRDWAAAGDVEALFRGMLPDLYCERVLRGDRGLVERRLGAIRDGTRELPDFCRGQVALHDTSFKDLLSEEGIAPQLREVRCPTLVVAAEFDRLYPPQDSAYIARHIPGAEYLLVPDAGHAVVAERPETINLLMAGHLGRFQSHP